MSLIDSLFNTFHDTVVLKDTTSLTNQIEELKTLKTRMPNNKEIDKDIKLLELGKKGEDNIIYELKNANIGLYVLRDVTIKYEDTKAQIGFIVVSKGYIYLIECKNLIGNIYVNNNGEFRREYEINGKKYKEAIYSPYTQSMRHKEIIKKKWISENNKLKVKILNNYFDNYLYKPLVVIANSKSIVNTKYAPRDIKNKVVRLDNLVRYIKNDLNNYDRDSLSSQKTMLYNANYLLNSNVEEYHSIASKYTNYVNNANTASNNVLLESLKKFRKDTSKRMNIPAYYVFTDKELDKIVKTKPQKIEDLYKILPSIKVKTHGKNIIKIINENHL